MRLWRATRRWTAKDPIGLLGGVAGLYVYVESDPINLGDINGLSPNPRDWPIVRWPIEAARGMEPNFDLVTRSARALATALQLLTGEKYQAPPPSPVQTRQVQEQTVDRRKMRKLRQAGDTIREFEILNPDGSRVLPGVAPVVPFVPIFPFLPNQDSGAPPNDCIPMFPNEVPVGPLF